MPLAPSTAPLGPSMPTHAPHPPLSLHWHPLHPTPLAPSTFVPLPFTPAASMPFTSDAVTVGECYSTRGEPSQSEGQHGGSLDSPEYVAKEWEGGLRQQCPKRRQHADNNQVLDMVVGCTLPCLQMRRQLQLVESSQEVLGVGGYRPQTLARSHR